MLQDLLEDKGTSRTLEPLIECMSKQLSSRTLHRDESAMPVLLSELHQGCLNAGIKSTEVPLQVDI